MFFCIALISLSLVCKYRFTIHHRFVKPIYQSSFSMTEIKETHKQLSNCIIIQRKQNPVHTDHHIKLTLNKSIWPVLFAGLFLCVFSDISELESFASIDSRTEVSFCHRIAFSAPLSCLPHNWSWKMWLKKLKLCPMIVKHNLRPLDIAVSFQLSK